MAGRDIEQQPAGHANLDAFETAGGIKIEVHEEDAKNGVQPKELAKKLRRRLHQQVEGME